jgi:hypothetical protein
MLGSGGNHLKFLNNKFQQKICQHQGNSGVTLEMKITSKHRLPQEFKS